MKKSRFQKAREEKELKKKKDDEEAAKVYDSFVASFTEDEMNGKTFIRGGRILEQAGEGGAASFNSEGNDYYKLQSRVPDEKVALPVVNKEVRKESASKGRQIDDFFNEIKNRQDARDPVGFGSAKTPVELMLQQQQLSEAAAIATATIPAAGAAFADLSIFGMEKGSFDNGDPNTTNIYIGNLAPSITEEQLLELFGRYGDINSVKVMWPRTEEEKSRKRNCGFVSFKRRSDAEEAKLELQDYQLEEYKMILGWGKAVKINAAPFVLPTNGRPLPMPPAGVAPHLPPPPPLPFLPMQQQMMPRPPPPFDPSQAQPLPPRPPVFHNPELDPDSSIEWPDVPFQPKPPPPLPPSFYGDKASIPAVAPPPVRTPAEAAAAAAAIAASIAASIAATPEPATSSMTIPANVPAVNTAAPPAFPSFVPPTVAPLVTSLPSVPFVPAEPPRVEPPRFVEDVPREGDLLIQVTIPVDPLRKGLIDLLATYVAADGEAFEKTMKLKEETNPDFQFLFSVDSPEALYYRWRTYANIIGATAMQWKERPFKMMKNGNFMVPPPPPKIEREASPDRARSRSSSPVEVSSDGKKNREPATSQRDRDKDRDRDRDREKDSRDRDRDRDTDRRRKRSRSASPERRSHRRDRDDRDRDRDRDSNRDRDRDRDRDEQDRERQKGMTGAQIERARAKERLLKLSKLSKEDYREWKRMLAAVSLRRDSIKKTMGFAFDKIESAEEIISMVKERLFNASDSAAVKIVGLFLLSDILHNSGAPIKHASNYRTLIQNLLPEAIENLATVFRATLGRMSAFQIEDRVKKLFSAWESWSIFPALYLNGLNAAFYMTESEYLQLQLSIAQQQQQQREGDRDRDREEEEQLDAIRRRAKASGIAVTASSTMAELTCKLDYCEKYLKRALGGGLLGLPRGASALSRAAAAEDEEDDGEAVDGLPMDDGDDIDGVPMDAAVSSSGFSVRPSNSNRSAFYELPSSKDYDDDDDIDGVPMDLPVQAEYNDDIDGVPFHDIDGVPMSDAIPTAPVYSAKKETSEKMGIVNYDSDSDDSMEGARRNSGSRRKDQELEARLLLLRDQLEARGTPEAVVAATLQEIRDKETSSSYNSSKSDR